MTNLKPIAPPFPTGKNGSFVSSERNENPIRIHYFVKDNEPNTLYANVSFTTNSEGPPGHVHGGCQAAVLDEIMGSCGWAHSQPVVAKKIDIDFQQMMPVDKKYQAFSRITKIEGRKVFVEGRILSGNTTYAEGTGLFIILSSDKIEELKKLI